LAHSQTVDQLKLERETMLTLRFVATLSLCLSALALGGCETTTAGGAVGADRSQLMRVSSEQMDQMSVQGYAKLKSQASAKGALNKDQAMLQRVRTIASRLEPQTRTFRPDAPGWKWEVNVIESNELNAFCMPGGKIMVYSGLISQLRLSDDEIAIVLGHEIAHALREHSREHVSQAMAAQAGLWQKMINASKGGQPPEFLSSHPAEASRVQQIQALLPTVMPLYVAAGGRR
jgi:Zn-dependent protease with chaperone function